MTAPTLGQVTRLVDRVTAARHGKFVGRVAELELFHTALAADAPSFAILYVCGPGGIGKTSLLHEYAYMAQEHGRRAIFLDGRNLDPTPAGFLLGLHQALGLRETGTLFATIAHQPNIVLLVDTCEALAPLDGWLRHTFLPQLPEQALVILAGRHAPAVDWRAGAGWGSLMRIISLRNLRPEESRAYLKKRGVPAEHLASLLSFTHGHPMALSLVADILHQREDTTLFDLQSNPDIVRVLLECFLQDVPDSTRRQALEICAHVYASTEAMLAFVLGVDVAHSAFNWLRRLSFIEEGLYGQFPHDLARDVVDTDLRWRNAEQYQQMHQQLRQYLLHRIQETGVAEYPQYLYELLYLYRRHPLMQTYYEWKAVGTIYAEAAVTSDHDLILQMTRRHEGEASAQIIRHWLQRFPQGFFILRDGNRQAAGFAAYISLNAVTAEDLAQDPATVVAVNYMQRYGPLRPGEKALHFRIWLGRDEYQGSLAVHNIAAMLSIQLILKTPRLAWTFMALAEPGFWEAMFTLANFRREPEADFTVGGRRYGVFVHDWRAEPVASWMEILGKRELEAWPKSSRYFGFGSTLLTSPF